MVQSKTNVICDGKQIFISFKMSSSEQHTATWAGDTAQYSYVN